MPVTGMKSDIQTRSRTSPATPEAMVSVKTNNQGIRRR
jgi:hypothetical protein